MKKTKISRDFKQISISTFFDRNRHLLGFDTKPKALLTSIKEAVENSLDAVEELSYKLIKEGKKPIFPEIYVKLERYEKKGNRELFRLIVEDNGPGVPKKHAPRAFATFLYGTKFHKLKQRRGQQGIGISAVTLYAQRTSGLPIRVDSKTYEGEEYYYVLKIDVEKNEPIIIEEGKKAKIRNIHGTRLELVLEGKYISTGDKSIYEYLRRTSLANPHATIIFEDPDGNKIKFERRTDEFPKEPIEIKPHPYGIEIGILEDLLKNSGCKTILDFLINTFSGIGRKTAEEILKKAKIDPKKEPSSLASSEIKRLHSIFNEREVKLRSPPLDCLSPIGSKNLERALIELYKPDFVSATTRKPKVYRGFPFLVEVAIGYGKSIKLMLKESKERTIKSFLMNRVENIDEGKINEILERAKINPSKNPKKLTDEEIENLKIALYEFNIKLKSDISGFNLMRFANKVPLLYDQNACVITKAVKSINWKNYDINQDKSGIPLDDFVLVVHVASVWLPFTSESKFAIAHYEEIEEEIRLAIQEVARKLREYKRKQEELMLKARKRKIFYAYAKYLTSSLKLIFKDIKEEHILNKLRKMIDRKLKLEEEKNEG